MIFNLIPVLAWQQVSPLRESLVDFTPVLSIPTHGPLVGGLTVNLALEGLYLDYVWGKV